MPDRERTTSSVTLQIRLSDGPRRSRGMGDVDGTSCSRGRVALYWPSRKSILITAIHRVEISVPEATREKPLEPAPTGTPAGSSGYTTVLEILTIMLRHRHLILGGALGLGVLTVVVGLLLPRTYTVSASFMPQVAGNRFSQFAGVAAQLGVTVPGDEPGQSPEFYASLLRSDAVLRPLALREYSTTRGDSGWSGTLIEWFDIGGVSPTHQLEDTIEELRNRIKVRTDRRTSVVHFSVKTRDPYLSTSIVDAAIDRLGRFDVDTRRSRAGAERRFIEGRLAEILDTLRAAEDRVEAFLESNRLYRNSPQLMFEHDRLQRDLRQAQQLHNTLAQAHEQARINEVRNTPVLTVVETPHVPARPDRRGLVVTILIALLVGAVFGSVVALWREFLRRSQSLDPRGSRDFASLRREVRDEAMAVLRRIRLRSTS